jgi:hypothetical protein
MENGQNDLKFRASELLAQTAPVTELTTLVSKVSVGGVQIVPKPAEEMDFLQTEGTLKSKVIY